MLPRAIDSMPLAWRLAGDSRILLIVAGLMLAALLFKKLVRQRPAEVHKRGVLLRDDTSWRRPRRKLCPDRLTLAGVAVAAEDECKHFKLIGTTGTGKSTAISELLAGAIARGDRAVFADPEGGYQQQFYDRYRGDRVLNPFETDSVRWDIFSEIVDDYDVDQLVSSLIPNSEDAAAGEWRGYARTFAAAVVRRCCALRRHDSGELWRLLAVAPVEELRRLVANTPAQPFLDPDNLRMFASIRAVAISAIAALQFVHRQRGTLFSVRGWVCDHPGLLFIPYRAGQISALRSMIATWLRLAIFESMNQPQNRDQRLWFVIDELDALGNIDGLKDALARLRKFGGRCVIGFQSVAQVSATYGAAEAQTIVENCGNTLILRCSGSENGGTSQFASRLIGEREVSRRQISYGRDRESSFSARGGRRSRNVTDQLVTESAVLPSQLEQLPDLCGYLKRASSPEWSKVKIGMPRLARRAAR